MFKHLFACSLLPWRCRQIWWKCHFAYFFTFYCCFRSFKLRFQYCTTWGPTPNFCYKLKHIYSWFMKSFVLVLGWCSIYITMWGSENDRKIEKITISPYLLLFQWQHQNFNMFSCTMVICLYIVSKTVTIKSIKFSEILRPNIGLIDPGPLLQSP